MVKTQIDAPFIGAAKIYEQLRSCDLGSQEYWHKTGEIIQLCWKAISLNRNDGDSHVLLANVLLLAALGEKNNNDTEEYSHKIYYCAAVIQAWKTTPIMHSRQREQGEKIYREVLERLQENDFPKSNDLDLDVDQKMQAIYHLYYPPAIGLDGKSRIQEYIIIFDNALKRNPKDCLSLNEKGRCLAALGQHNEAITLYNKILEFQPVDRRAWYNKGISLDALKLYEEAIHCYDKTLEINPKDDAAWNNKGLSLYYLGRYEDAIRCCDKAISINSKGSDIWNNKGISLAALGKHTEAIHCYDLASEIDPNFSSPWNNKGISLEALGRKDEAILCFTKARKL